MHLLTPTATEEGSQWLRAAPLNSYALFLRVIFRCRLLAFSQKLKYTSSPYSSRVPIADNTPPNSRASTASTKPGTINVRHKFTLTSTPHRKKK